MFYKYEVKDNALYLYLRVGYEFSRELDDFNDKELSSKTRDFIRNNDIDFSGDKVYLIVNGAVVKTVDVSNDDHIVEVLNMKLYYSNEYYKVKVKNEDDNKEFEITLKEYLLGVLLDNKYLEFHEEVIKSLSILLRTYVFLKMSTDNVLKCNDGFISLKPLSYYKLALEKEYYNRYFFVDKCIDETDCLFLSYNDKYILPFVHYSNIGKTYYNSKYPYLSSVKSLWDYESPYYVNINKYEISEFMEKFEVSDEIDVKVLDVDSRDNIRKIMICGKLFTGEEFKNILGLKSLNIKIIIYQESVHIISLGYGMGYGLSLFGANKLAMNGCNYSNILKYYFPKVKLNKYIKELS